jgi:hypothetical protein
MPVGTADRVQLAVFVGLATLLAMSRRRTGVISPPLPQASELTHTAAPLLMTSPNASPSMNSLPKPALPGSNHRQVSAISLEDGSSATAAAVITPTTRNIPFVAVGCGVMGPHHDFRSQKESITLQACAASCASRAYRHFGLLLSTECWCADSIEHIEMLQTSNGGGEAEDGKCKLERQRHTSVFRIDTVMPEVITMFIAPAKRTSSLFTSGRLERYFSGKYAYRYRKLNAGVFRSDAIFKKEVCETTPGKKIFVQIAGSVTYLLQNWPDNSALIITADEIGNWGLGKDDRRFGPHGKGREFKSNESSEYKHILLPARIFPIFKQYHHFRQVAAFGDTIRFVPLGSRNEFPDVPPNAIVEAPKRRYVFSYMAALTDSTRKKVHELLSNDKMIPKEKSFMQVSQSWHGSANNDEYVSPEKYQQIMLQSMFAICPKGHSVEQFRIYEAIEAGAIPVMDLQDGYLAQHLPPAYLESPMLLLNGWDTVVDEMVKLWKDPVALHKRQQRLLSWYEQYMRSKMIELEVVLESRATETPSFCPKSKH